MTELIISDFMHENIRELREHEIIDRELTYIKTLALLLRECTLNSEHYEVKPIDIDDATAKLRSLCDKHEIRLPDSPINWAEMEII